MKLIDSKLLFCVNCKFTSLVYMTRIHHNDPMNIIVSYLWLCQWCKKLHIGHFPEKEE